MPKAIEIESIIDGCESGNCIHKSKCFYGQVGFGTHPPPKKNPEDTERKGTSVAEGQEPRAVRKWPEKTPKFVDVMHSVRRRPADDIEERPPPEPAYRADSMAQLLPVRNPSIINEYGT